MLSICDYFLERLNLGIRKRKLNRVRHFLLPRTLKRYHATEEVFYILLLLLMLSYFKVSSLKMSVYVTGFIKILSKGLK